MLNERLERQINNEVYLGRVSKNNSKHEALKLFPEVVEIDEDKPPLTAGDGCLTRSPIEANLLSARTVKSVMDVVLQMNQECLLITLSILFLRVNISQDASIRFVKHDQNK